MLIVFSLDSLLEYIQSTIPYDSVLEKMKFIFGHPYLNERLDDSLQLQHLRFLFNTVQANTALCPDDKENAVNVLFKNVKARLNWEREQHLNDDELVETINFLIGHSQSKTPYSSPQKGENYQDELKVNGSIAIDVNREAIAAYRSRCRQLKFGELRTSSPASVAAI